MNHVNDIAEKVADLLAADPAIYKAAVVQGEPAEVEDYPNRDGTWYVYLVDYEGRAFKATVTPVGLVEAATVIEETTAS